MTLSGLVGFLLFLLKIIDLDLAFSLISGSAELLNHTSIKAFPHFLLAQKYVPASKARKQT